MSSGCFRHVLAGSKGKPLDAAISSDGVFEAKGVRMRVSDDWTRGCRQTAFIVLLLRDVSGMWIVDLFASAPLRQTRACKSIVSTQGERPEGERACVYSVRKYLGTQVRILVRRLIELNITRALLRPKLEITSILYKVASDPLPPQ